MVQKRTGIEIVLIDSVSRPARVIRRSLDEIDRSARHMARGISASEGATKTLATGLFNLETVISRLGFAPLVREIIQTNSGFAHLEASLETATGSARALLRILKDAQDAGFAVERALFVSFDKAAGGLADLVAAGKLDVGGLLQDINRQIAGFALKQVQADIIETVFPGFGTGAQTDSGPGVLAGGGQTTPKEPVGFRVLFGDVQRTSKAFNELTTATAQHSQITMGLVQSTQGATKALSGAFLPALGLAASGLAQLFGGGGLNRTGQTLSTIVGIAGQVAGGFAGRRGGFGGSSISTTGFGAGSPFGSGVGSGIGGAPRFASGGSLTVPGFGPADSRAFFGANVAGPPVVARVSPGERISFTPRASNDTGETDELLRDLRVLLMQIAGSTRGTERALAAHPSGRGFNQDGFSSAADAGLLIQNAVARNK